MVALQAAPAVAEKYNDPREKQAHVDCQTGKVEAGIQLLAEVFTETHKPYLVYNQARCYEQNSRPAEAINRFREYLRVAKEATADERADVERHIAECQALQAEQKKETSAAPATAPASPPPPPIVPALSPETAQITPPAPLPPAAPPAPASAVPDLSAPASPPDVSSPAFYKTWWFWTGAAVVAGTLTAVFFATRSSGPCDGSSLTCMGVQ